MANAQTPLILKEQTHSLAWEGLLLGGKIGLIVASSYAMAGLLIVEFLGQGVGFSALPFEAGGLGKLVAAILATLTMILLLAIIPATILGAITGMYLGQLAKLTGDRLPIHLFLAICVSSCLVVIILFHSLFKIPVVLSFQNPASYYSIGVYETYPFAIGIPSVIYVLMGIWVGWKLYSKAVNQKSMLA